MSPEVAEYLASLTEGDLTTKQSWTLPWNTPKAPVTPASRGFGTYHTMAGADPDLDDEDDNTLDLEAEPTLAGGWTFRSTTARFNKFDPTGTWLADIPDPRERELETGHYLVRRYQSDPTPENYEQLFAHFAGGKESLIERTISSQRNRRLPAPAVRGRTYNAFDEAVRKWTPDKQNQAFHNFYDGVASNKVRKWAAENANFGKIPHTRASKLESLSLAARQHQLDTGQEATAEVLAEETGFSLKDVELLLKEGKDDLLGSRDLDRDGNVDRSAQYRRALLRIRDDLTPLEKEILDDLYGLKPGARPWAGRDGALAAKHGVQQPWLSKFKTKVNGRLTKQMTLEHG